MRCRSAGSGHRQTFSTGHEEGWHSPGQANFVGGCYRVIRISLRSLCALGRGVAPATSDERTTCAPTRRDLRVTGLVIEYISFAVYVLAGPVTWVLLGVGM